MNPRALAATTSRATSSPSFFCPAIPQKTQLQATTKPQICPRILQKNHFYWLDGRFGLSQVRLQTWFPFDVHVVVNGREWLARELDRADIGYVRRDNCFIEIAHMTRAQKLLDRQPKLDWCGQLSRLLRRVHPQHAEFFAASPLDYYWTSEQTEWATDVLFRDAAVLGELYRTLVRRGIDTFGSRDVLRFLGHKLPAHGGVNGNYRGVVQSDLKQRVEGIRLKHRAGWCTWGSGAIARCGRSTRRTRTCWRS